MLSAYTECVKKPNNINRRVLFAGMLAVPIARPIDSAAAPYERAQCEPQVTIEKMASELAGLMAEVHGGEWRFKVAPDDGYLVMSRHPPRTRS